MQRITRHISYETYDQHPVNAPILSSRTRNRYGLYPDWSEAEAALIRKWWHKKSAKEIKAFLPDRSLSAIAGKAFRLGLRKRVNHPQKMIERAR